MNHPLSSYQNGVHCKHLKGKISLHGLVNVYDSDSIWGYIVLIVYVVIIGYNSCVL